jgi:hypothetical protein
VGEIGARHEQRLAAAERRRERIAERAGDCRGLMSDDQRNDRQARARRARERQLHFERVLA